MSQFRNLVFKGGGVKGIAYIGAISVLEERGVMKNIRRVCGTSSGALMAAHIAMGGRAHQLGEMMSSRFLGGLLDGSAWPVSGFTRLIQDYGWFHGKRLSMWLKRHVERLSGKVDLTFGELARLSEEDPNKYKILSMVATNVTHQCPHVFDADSTPDVCVWEALRASMSIPFLFSAIKLPESGLFVDGGLTWNYPLSVYDYSNYLSNADDDFLYAVIDQLQDINSKQFYNKETLGLMVETRSRRKVNPSELYDENQKIKSFPNYLKAMLGLMTDVTAGNYLSLPDWQRTIFIEAYGVRSTDFNISSYGIERLIDSGRRAAVAYLDWFKKPGMEQMNKVVHNN